MSPLRFRVTFLAFATGAVVALSLFLALSARVQETTMYDQIKISLEVERHLSKVEQPGFDQALFDSLKDVRKRIEPREREQALSQIIQAYSSQSQRLLKSRVSPFVSSELKYRVGMELQRDRAKERFDFWLGGAAVSLLVGLFLIIIFVYARVFAPVKRLSEQMMAFLNGQYSYRFDSPTQDEMGNLQATFNSMAQKVLHNLDELKMLDQAKSDFLNIASHELRTPMTSIKGSLGLINSGVMGDLNPEVLSLMKIAEGETDRLIRLINDILDMAKIEAGRLPLKQAWFKLSDLLKDCQSGMHGLAETSKVSIDIDCEAQYRAYGDRDRLQQVLTNFLSNALKFSPTGSSVRIMAIVNQANELQIEVVDQGRGISPEDQAQLFQKFRQATNSESPLVKGTGLGLAISKALIEQHGGQVGVRSNPGQGSTFYFSIPRFAVSAENKEVQSASQHTNVETEDSADKDQNQDQKVAA